MNPPTARAGGCRSLALVVAGLAGCGGGDDATAGTSTGEVTEVTGDAGSAGTDDPAPGTGGEVTSGPAPTSGTGASGDATTGGVTTGGVTTGETTAVDETTGDETSGDETSGDETSGDETSGAGCGPAPMVGKKTETITVAGVERTYLVVVPASIGDQPVPVLLGFHGGSGTSEDAAEGYGLTGAEAMLYVYPQAPYWREAGGVAWNVDPAGVDFPYFDAMIADLAEKYCIDPARIFAAGQSNGGFFVNALACYRPEVLRAIAPVAGGGPPGMCTPSTVTMMGVHGTADMTVPIASGAFARDYWMAANGCSGAPSEPIEPAPCVAYQGCAEPVLWCAHAGGHAWPAFAGPAIRGFFLSL